MGMPGPVLLQPSVKALTQSDKQVCNGPNMGQGTDAIG